jgi:hypothetical protein
LGTQRGLGYNISDKDFIDFEFNYGYGKYSSKYRTAFDEGIEPGGTLNNYLSYQDRSRGGNFYSINGSYRHDFTGKGHNLMAQFQYRTRQGEERTINQLEELDGTISSGQFNTEDGPGTEVQLNLDYTRPFGEASKLEAGYQARLGVSNDVTELYWYNPKVVNMSCNQSLATIRTTTVISIPFMEYMLEKVGNSVISLG